MARSPVPSPSIGAMAAAAFDRTDDARATPRRGVRRARGRGWDHRRRRRARRRDTGAAHRTRRARRLRQRDLVEELQAHPRRSAVPPERRRPPRLRGTARTSAPAEERSPSRSRPAVHDPRAHQGRRHLAQDRPRPRIGDVDVRPDRRLADRQAAPAAPRRRRVRAPADDAARAAWLRPTSTTTPPPTMPASRWRSSAPRHGTAQSSPTAAASRRSPATPTDGSTAPWSTPEEAEVTIRARVVVSATGVWTDEVRALDEEADPDSIRPAKGIHLTVPWDKVRNDIAVVIPVPRDRRSLFVVPWGPRPTARTSTPTSAPPTPTTTVRSTIRSAPATTSPTSSARSTTRSRPASRPTT